MATGLAGSELPCSDAAGGHRRGQRPAAYGCCCSLMRPPGDCQCGTAAAAADPGPQLPARRRHRRHPVLPPTHTDEGDAGGPPHPSPPPRGRRPGAVPVRGARVGDHPAHRVARGRRLPAEGPGRRGGRVRRGRATGGGRRDRRRPHHRGDPVAAAPRGRSVGSSDPPGTPGPRADGGRQLEPGDRRRPRHHPARRGRVRVNRSSTSWGCQPGRGTHAACWRCSTYLRT